MKRIMFSLLLMLASAAQAEPVVVVSASSNLDALTQDEVRQIFNGQTRRVSGISVKPLHGAVPGLTFTSRCWARVPSR